ncbi:DNA-binding transcriptional MocR family regulator [Anaerosolibacter carboniphilus]|uniref:DNA-binding transcriptional MocR family regulator n=1 Tax=Anaerosolibacter carboniphilus TaxID=1417629 RepID=A0A841L612_9FIRM|nr:PLP-dependent aminotransferase family protein [Anaerosolibacter carboniphilus]MBB6218532.1 DNA-binding transcriptional MocR family regulator [Anaerosolibacter carboniphilus]
MNILIDKSSMIPIHQQLYQQISDRILSGLMKEGERLPSIRSMSESLTLSPMTIVKVYQQLEDHGLIERAHGKGTFVKRKDLLKNTQKDDLSNPYQWQISISDYLSRSRFRYNPSLSAGYSGYNLSIASLNHQLLPTKRILKEAYSLLEKNLDSLGKYGPVQGDLSFRETAAQYLKNKGIVTSAQNILVTSGAQQGISLIAHTFVGPGDIVIMEAPTYPGAIDIFKSRGATILTVPVDTEGMRTDLLLSLCDKYSPKLIYTIPRFHNPTGYSMSQRRKIELLAIAHHNNCMIIEDDPWSEITYSTIKAKPLKSMDTLGHIIYLKSFSKIIGPGYRVCAMVAEGSILDRLIAAKANLDSGAPLLTQKAIIPFLESNAMVQYLRQLNLTLSYRRDKMIKVLKANAPTGVTWTIPEGGVVIWVTLPKHFDIDSLFYRSVADHNISFLPGTVCYANEPEFNHLRLCFSYLDEDELEICILSLCRLIRDMMEHQGNHSPLPMI